MAKQRSAITTNIVSSNHSHVEMYSILHSVIKFVNDLRWISLGTSVSFSTKTDPRDITEILLKVNKEMMEWIGQQGQRLLDATEKGI